jgi:hypothetical protein
LFSGLARSDFRGFLEKEFFNSNPCLQQLARRLISPWRNLACLDFPPAL